MSYELKEKFRPPSETLYLTEPFRAIFELGTLPFYEPWLNTLRGGDGHPVLVIKIPIVTGLPALWLEARRKLRRTT
jgi:hypothetical protein